MGKKEFVEAWNKAFFANGELNNATLDIEIAMSFPGGTVRFAVQGVTPKTRVNELARAYASSLPEVAAGEQAAPEARPKSPESPPETIPEEIRQAEGAAQPPAKEVIANEHITYRRNRYLVQHYRLDGVEHYNIFNEGTGKAVSPDSVTGRSILKGYREKQSGVEEAGV